jgi:hypothetical protein
MHLPQTSPRVARARCVWIVRGVQPGPSSTSKQRQILHRSPPLRSTRLKSRENGQVIFLTLRRLDGIEVAVADGARVCDVFTLRQ